MKREKENFMEKVTNAQDMDLDVSLGQGPTNKLINKRSAQMQAWPVVIAQ